ncbi:MAG: hypothetical protein P8184_12215 [Calditrichia bacterium]
MNKLQLKPVMLGIAAIVIGAVIVLIQNILIPESGGTFLLTLTFWVALIQGAVAVVAAADASAAKWITPLKRELLSFYPLILFIAILFLFLGLQMDVYPWIDKQNKWLNVPFFLVRNFLAMLVLYIVAHFYAKATLANSEGKGRWAIAYLFIYVTVQSLVAFDWVMSLAYPWVSTLFGGIFFMEAFYTGLVIAALIAAYYLRKEVEDPVSMSKVLRDTAVFTFGFALAWAGLFYAQFLVIWYGNIPEETSYLVIRMHHSPYMEIFYVSVFFLFILPFVGLIGRKAKISPNWVTLVAFIVLAGIVLERILFILPDASINPIAAVAEFILMGFLFLLFFASRDQFIKALEMSK